MNLISQYKLQNISKLETAEGFWVNASGTLSIDVGSGNEYGIEKINLNSGWNLVGVGKDITLTDLNNFGSINTVWKWNGSSWQIWSPNSNIMNLISQYKLQSISIIEKGEGFWVNK